MASKPSMSSNDVAALLAAQGQRRRKRIYDERKGLDLRIEQTVVIQWIWPWVNPSLAHPDDSTAPQLPWTPTDEEKVTLFSLEENPNYKCNPVAFSKVEILDALEQGYTGDNVLAFLNARTDLELEMMRSSHSSKHSFYTAEETDSVHAYAYNRNEPKSLYFHPNAALSPSSSTVDQATVLVEPHGNESTKSAHLPFAGHAASSVSPSDKNSSSPLFDLLASSAKISTFVLTSVQRRHLKLLPHRPNSQLLEAIVSPTSQTQDVPTHQSLTTSSVHFTDIRSLSKISQVCLRPARTRPLPPPIKIFPAHAVLDLDALSTPDSAPLGSPNKFDGKPTTFNMDLKPFNLDRSVASLYTFNSYLRNRETNRANHVSPSAGNNDRDESGRDRAGPSTTQMGPAEETNETTAENAETTEEPAALFGANAPNNPPVANGSDESDEDTFTLKGLAKALHKIFPEGFTVGMANAMPALMKAIDEITNNNDPDDGSVSELTKEERYLKYLCEHIETLSISKVQAEQKERVASQLLRLAIERQKQLEERNESFSNVIGLWERSFRAVCPQPGNAAGPTAPTNGESSTASAAREAALANTTQPTAQQPVPVPSMPQQPVTMWPMVLAQHVLSNQNKSLLEKVEQLTTRCRSLEQRHLQDHPSDADFLAGDENWNPTTLGTAGFNANSFTSPPFAPIPIDAFNGVDVAMNLAMNNPHVVQSAGYAFLRDFNNHLGRISDSLAANLAQQPAPPVPVPGPQPPTPGATAPSPPTAPTNPAPFPGAQGPAGPSGPAGAL
ncbi:hypothetical protein H2199_000055 [Coniosporium tulheliwenetii]|uniref:Uncharacterized protein n=1 Tax=Coniosporium tulheliwenetii TaxID=3383036 RepID=A0ACC2ZP27_9PEZI|nr:hypothetical protein H2199_000055 [Cladosporium sp. JES 115]